jgi:hypothetical protein
MLPSRRTQVFIVTILEDDEAPSALRGRVRRVRDDQETPFVTEAELLRLLKSPEQAAPRPDQPLPPA